MNDTGFTIKTKVDGAPSVIAGWCPKTNRFFVGTKSLFNKTPKINFTYEDIERNHGHSPGLCKKLKLGLEHFRRTIKSGIYQGDFMFDEFDITLCEGEISFKPNTIEYKISDSVEKAKIINAKVGVIWHTKYSVSEIEDLSVSTESLVAQFDGDTSEILEDSFVWTASTDFKDEYNFSKMNQLEEDMFMAGLDRINRHISSLLPEANEIFNRESDISKMAMIFINARIKKGLKFINREETLVDFLEFISIKYIKQIEKLTSAKGRAKKIEEYKKVKKDILLKNGYRQAVMGIFEIHSWLQSLKDITINKLEEASKQDTIKNYIDNVLTGPEGYVIIDKSNNEAYKFVNRMEFSKANFNIQKSW